jgi:hypothetical protein
VAIPKLGELRKLPEAENEAADDPRVRGEERERSRFSRAGFGIAGLVAAASLLIAGFCGIRWSLADLPASTEEHISRVRQALSEQTAAELIREYEDMEARGLDLGLPFRYKELEMRKAKWGKDASIAASVGVVALLVAIGFASSGRRKTG